MFRLIDDGTLDTVVECGECGGWERFDIDSTSLLGDQELDDQLYAGDNRHPSTSRLVSLTRARRIATAIEWAEMDHECDREDRCAHIEEPM